MGNIIEDVKQEIISAVKSDDLVLPTLPEIALKVRSVAEDPEASLNSLGNEISNDPALSARIIKVANSPLMRAAHEIRDLKMALTRLGMEYTATIAVGLAMEQMFQATSSLIDKRMRDVWQRSSEIAGICHIICSHRTHLQADQAMLAGLTHKIGVLPILTFAEEHPVLLKDSFSLDTTIKKLHPAIGTIILKKWEFPKAIQEVPITHLKFTRDIAEPDYADIVTVSMLQSYMGSDSEWGNVDYTQVTAFKRLGLEADNPMHSDALDEQISDAAQMLQ
ncbi:MAG: HDOD domain-containing protein [Cellvibrionaceae bacterium]|nr:HDOD domain-containing protein [Cellvibrionaceae bacterium]